VIGRKAVVATLPSVGSWLNASKPEPMPAEVTAIDGNKTSKVDPFGGCAYKKKSVV
jgi:hypothetical protein